MIDLKMAGHFSQLSRFALSVRGRLIWGTISFNPLVRDGSRLGRSKRQPHISMYQTSGRFRPKCLTVDDCITLDSTRVINKFSAVLQMLSSIFNSAAHCV